MLHQVNQSIDLNQIIIQNKKANKINLKSGIVKDPTKQIASVRNEMNNETFFRSKKMF